LELQDHIQYDNKQKKSKEIIPQRNKLKKDEKEKELFSIHELINSEINDKIDTFVFRIIE
jgi:hypothetical protein